MLDLMQHGTTDGLHSHEGAGWCPPDKSKPQQPRSSPTAKMGMLTLNVIAKNLAMTLSATLAKTLRTYNKSVSRITDTAKSATYLATLSTARHVDSDEVV